MVTAKFFGGLLTVENINDIIKSSSSFDFEKCYNRYFSSIISLLESKGIDESRREIEAKRIFFTFIIDKKIHILTFQPKKAAQIIDTAYDTYNSLLDQFANDIQTMSYSDFTQKRANERRKQTFAKKKAEKNQKQEYGKDSTDGQHVSTNFNEKSKIAKVDVIPDINEENEHSDTDERIDKNTNDTRDLEQLIADIEQLIEARDKRNLLISQKEREIENLDGQMDEKRKFLSDLKAQINETEKSLSVLEAQKSSAQKDIEHAKSENEKTDATFTKIRRIIGGANRDDD